MKYFCCMLKWFSWGKTLVWFFKIENNAFSKGYHFYLKELTTGTEWLFILGFLRDIFSKIRQTETFTLRIVTVFVFYSNICAFKLIKVILMDEIYLYYIIKYANIWKICISQWINIFQMSNTGHEIIHW